MIAMRLSRIYCLRTISAKDIFFFRDGFKMIWIYAVSITTKMIDFQSRWNFTLVQPVRKSMCKNTFSVFANLAIAVRAFPTYPSPAVISFNYTRPESLFR